MRLIPYFLLTLLLVGCSTATADRAKAIPSYEPKNVFKTALPKTFTRVAVLPVVVPSEYGRGPAISGIQSALVGELIKSKRFEVLPISGDALREMVGKSELTSLEEWPYTLKEKLTALQVDGVVLIEVTHLRSYAPIAMGVKARLVSITDAKTLWSVDEFFDAGVPSVFAAAKRYEMGMVLESSASKSKNTGSIEYAPSRFAMYAGDAIFSTLP